MNKGVIIMEGIGNNVVSVPKTVKSGKLKQSSLINYMTHPKYLEVSSNTDLTNVGKDVTLMMLDDSINDDGFVTDVKLFVSKLDTMVKRGKRPPSSTKGGKEDYTDEMLELESKVNKLIKGKKFINKKEHDIKPMFYFRDDTKLQQNKDKKKSSK
jgi:hypothetical protein